MAQLLLRDATIFATASSTLALLGPPQIALNGTPLAFAYEKVRALLVFLAVESDRAHRRAALADLLWPEQDEAAARHSLSQALWSLRRTLPDIAGVPLLLTTRDTVRLNPDAPIWLDVAAFQQLGGVGAEARKLRQAVVLYRGEFLEGWGIGESAAFEEWALLTREHLRARACDALRQLTEPGAAPGDAAQAWGYARRWVALDPLSEEAHRRVMRTLAESGQRTAALAQFAHCRRLLHDELGIEPEPATLALYEELKQSEVPPPAPSTMPSRVAPPLPPTRLIGREREQADIATLLADPATRLITIAGPGGVGKTRLGLHAAQAHNDGVCFVSLAPVREAGLVLAAIAEALGVQQNGARPLGELVPAALGQRPPLLLLDNCEHLLPELAALVAELLAAAPALVVLATSRVALHLSHERRYRLAPLGLDQRAINVRGASPLTPQHCADQPAAVALFVERARAARADVELDYAAIGAICQRLDGLPLAIELAATRARLLAPRDLLARLDQRLPLLSGGARDTPERHQTLRATIDWSYQLLHPRQQALFRHLAVFAGGWTVAAAEAICAEPPNGASNMADALDGLAALLDASLIGEMAGAGEPRCAMLETIREYAHGELVAHGELHRAQERHARYAAALAAQAAASLNSLAQNAWLQRLDAELDNVRAALRWCAAHDAGTGLRLASDLSRFWDIRGLWREGRAWLETLLQPGAGAADSATTIEERAAGLLVAGVLATFLRDFEPATQRLRESLDLYQRLGDRQCIGRVLNVLGNVALYQGAYAKAERHYREGLALRRACGHAVGVAASLNNVALASRMQGDWLSAKDYFGQSLALYRELGDRAAAAHVTSHIAAVLLLEGNQCEALALFEGSLAVAEELGYKPGIQRALSGLGDVARAQRRYGDAKGYYRQCLALSAESHDIAGTARSLFCLATIAYAEGCVERAAALLGATAALNRDACSAQAPEEAAEFERHVACVRDALGAASFAAAWARGQAVTVEQAAVLALETLE